MFTCSNPQKSMREAGWQISVKVQQIYSQKELLIMASSNCVFEFGKTCSALQNSFLRVKFG